MHFSFVRAGSRSVTLFVLVIGISQLVLCVFSGGGLLSLAILSLAV